MPSQECLPAWKSLGSGMFFEDLRRQNLTVQQSQSDFLASILKIHGHTLCILAKQMDKHLAAGQDCVIVGLPFAQAGLIQGKTRQRQGAVARFNNRMEGVHYEI